MANNNIKGTHFQGPLLGSDSARGGLLRDVPLAATEAVRSPYKVAVENFEVATADGSIALGGATLTDVGTAVAETVTVGGVDPIFAIYAGTSADTGVNVQFNAAPNAATTVSPTWKTIGPRTETATSMDNKELFFETRVGFASDTTAWDGKACFGWIVTDTGLMTPTTGALDIAAGGGIGFHVAEDGTLGYFSDAGAITTSTATGINVLTDLSLEAAGAYKWYTFGARQLVTDASAATGSTEFYINGRKIATVVDSTVATAAAVYSMTFECANGPARDSYLGVDYIVSGVTRSGLARPYSSGNW